MRNYSPLSPGEVCDRAITIVVGTLRITIPASIGLFFMPIIIIQIVEAPLLHSRWFERFGFGYVDDIIGALADVALVAIFSAKLDARHLNLRAAFDIVKRHGLSSVLLVIGGLLTIWIGTIAVLIPFFAWRYSSGPHVNFVARCIVTAISSPLAAAGIGILAAAYFCVPVVQTVIVEQDVTLIVGVRTAWGRLAARGNRLRTLIIALLSFSIIVVGYGLEQLISRFVPFAPHIVRPIVGWPFAVIACAIAVVFNREARNAYEGFDLEKSIAAFPERQQA